MRPRASAGWNTPVGKWISEVGVSTIVSALGRNPDLSVTDRAVYSWLKGFAPRYDRAQALVRLSKGRITMAQIYDHVRILREIRESANTVQNRSGPAAY